jgi:excisionase family DNA binding protein
MPDVAQEEYLTPAGASAALGIPAPAVRRMEARGRLEAGRTPGGHHRYRADSVRALREELDSAAAGAPDPEGLLTSGEVAAMFGVTAKTVSRWVQGRRIAPVQTSRGRRFRADEIRALLRGGEQAASGDAGTEAGP